MNVTPPKTSLGILWSISLHSSLESQKNVFKKPAIADSLDWRKGLDVSDTLSVGIDYM